VRICVPREPIESALRLLNGKAGGYGILLGKSERWYVSI